MDVAAGVPASEAVPGVLGFLVVAAMGLALFFLLRSMNKHLRKVSGGPPWQQNGHSVPPEPSGPQDIRPNGSRPG